MNPFDIRTVVLAKHAQHVVLIHFPIALFIAAVAFDYLAHWTKSGALAVGCLSSVLIWLVCWILWRVRRHPASSLPAYRLPIEAVAVLVIGLTAHLGGFLTGVNGPG